jgi:hypothetical protein
MSDDDDTDETTEERSSRWSRWLAVVAALIPAYLFSSGPIIALGCWLRDRTGHEWFYAVLILYYPVLYLIGDVDVVEAYIMWWMKLFGTMPPG